MNVYELMESAFTRPAELERLALHENWRVRYAAAVAIGQSQDRRWLPLLKEMLSIENARPLYTQTPAHFTNSTDDTRMAEQIGPITASFDHEVDDSTLDAWRCRGRVKQAVLFALHDIGEADDEIRAILHAYLEDPKEEYPIKAAAGRALQRVGNRSSIPALQTAQKFDEWCTQMEATKAIRSINLRL
ncbi:MAG: hypothetical protein U0175_34905 [Caldilineaceae bacterium]